MKEICLAGGCFCGLQKFFDLYGRLTPDSFPALHGDRDIYPRSRLFTIGLVLDVWTEKVNDIVEYARVANQRDFEKF